MSEPLKVGNLEDPLTPAMPQKVKNLNDCLALERTVMSNERTLLAYVRTALAILVVGVTIIKFFQSQGMIILGWTLLGMGVICLTMGLMRFTNMWHRLNSMGRCNGKDVLLGDSDD